jgi:hypothetical protein
MKKLLFLLLISLTGCATFQVSTLDHTPTYVVESINTKIRVIDNEFELHRLLKTDFNFRYDFAQYAIRQPIGWYYNNRFPNFRVFNRYSWFNGHLLGYMDASEMWNSWLWGYPYNYGVGWSYNWTYNRWSSSSWNHPHNWDTYYRYRGRTNINPRDNTNRPNTVRVTKKIKTTHIPNSRVIKSNPIPRQRFNIPTRTKSTPNPPVRSNTSTSTRSNSRRKN